MAPTTGVRIADPKPLIVPILRAGLGMLEGMVKLLPTAEVGFLGMARNEETLEPTTYAERLPDDLTDRQCFVLDPMLATGGSLVAAIELPARPRGDGRHRHLHPRRARGPRGRREGAARPRASPSCSAPSTSASTSTATSCPASATPATASTAPSDRRSRMPSGQGQLVAPLNVPGLAIAVALLLRNDLAAGGSVGAADLELDETLALQWVSQDSTGDRLACNHARTRSRHPRELLVLVGQLAALDPAVLGRPVDPRGEVAPVPRRERALQGVSARSEQLPTRFTDRVARLEDSLVAVGSAGLDDDDRLPAAIASATRPSLLRRGQAHSARRRR